MTISLAPLRRITPGPVRTAYRVTKRAVHRPVKVEIEPYATVEDLFASLQRHRDPASELARLQGLRPVDLMRLAARSQGKGRHVRMEVIGSREWLGRWCVTLSMLIPGAVLLGALIGMSLWAF